MDTTAVFEAVRNGGPSTIFVLVLVIALLLTGQIKAKASVDAELAALEKAHTAELASRDHQIGELIRMQDRLTDRMDRSQELFGTSLTLIREEMLPMLRSVLSSATSPPRAS